VENLDKFFYNKLTRITSTGLFIPQLDGLRFIAIFLVVLYHINERLFKNTATTDYASIFIKHVISNGFQGVPLFFVISGFILGLPFAKYYRQQSKKINLTQYYIRRLTRLEPPYIIIMVVLFFSYLAFDSGFLFKSEASHFFSSLAYLHNFIYFDSSPWRINVVTWSLEIEVQFYILAPLLAMVFKNNNAYIRRILIVSMISILILLDKFIYLNFVSLINHLHFFLAGFLLVDLYLSIEEINLNYIFSTFVGLIFLLIILTVKYSSSILFEYVYICSIIIFYLLVLKNDTWKKIFSFKVITTIGGMCYTIYLIHFPILRAIFKISNKFVYDNNYILDLVIQLLIVLPIILICSSVVYLIIEKPCMDKEWPKKLLNKLNSLRYVFVNRPLLKSEEE
jgi:peptidoglycan/LPS O-acetylase OafA/YrhL